MDDDRFACCSKCFSNEGMVYNSRKIGFLSDEICPECGRSDGFKLTSQQLAYAAYLFFVCGSYIRTEFGVAPWLQMNEHHCEDALPGSLAKDAKIVKKITNLRVFHYGPRLWMVGEIEPLKNLISSEHRQIIIEKIIKEYPTKFMNSGKKFYRMRKNPTAPNDHDQYDSPPQSISGGGRFCRSQKSIMYGSQDLEICIHETRSAVDDKLFVATLECQQNLKFIDLSAKIVESCTEFEILDLAVLFLFLAGEHAYEITRHIADAVEKAGFDGIIYPSFFSRVRSGAETIETVYGLSTRKYGGNDKYEDEKIVRNLAIFGRPVERGDVSVICINRVQLTHITYGAILGPMSEFD